MSRREFAPEDRINDCRMDPPLDSHTVELGDVDTPSASE
jgi:hypothetical protein